jgi:hypothetical protein
MAAPRYLTPPSAVISMIDGANGRVAPEVVARRSFLRAAAAERGPPTPVPPALRHAYDSWVRATITARHGRASDVHLGLHAFVLAHSLGLPSTRTRDSFFELAYGAADAIACMAASVYTEPEPEPYP